VPLRQRTETRSSAAALFHAGREAAMLGRLEDAADCYRAAIRANPSLTDARLALGEALHRLGRATDAIAVHAALIRREPDNAAGQLALGWLYGQQHRFTEALACFDRAERLGLDIGMQLAQVSLAFAHCCDWSRRDVLRRRLAARMRAPQPCMLDPYAILAQEDDAALHRATGERIAGRIAQSIAAVQPIRRRPPHREPPIRLGYLSADFNHHATSLLMAGVFEAHDRKRFTVHGYSYGPDDGSAMRRRVEAGFDHFIELGSMSDSDAARRIDADGIDVLIDLKGYVTGGRPQIAALRPAPVQASYLGYVATLGAPWMDYVIADPIVLPFGVQRFWSERIVQLPNSYYPNDRLRPDAFADGDRAAHGLPAEGFVFACFNNPYKITPDVFAVWMALLAAVPGSVLWLMEANPFNAANLQTEATRFRIDPHRLVFAPSAELGVHLARHAAADLFLDTIPYGAHTTGADALWAGLPLITCQGETFPSRVAASLLHAAGVPELVTTSLADYQALALRLAREPGELAAFRAHTNRSNMDGPLFDVVRFTRGLEAALTEMVDRARRGAAPGAFSVAETAAGHAIRPPVG
jgi:protein O-GlcNAc transferase